MREKIKDFKDAEGPSGEDESSGVGDLEELAEVLIAHFWGMASGADH